MGLRQSHSAGRRLRLADMFGSHLSISKGLDAAVAEAVRLGMDTLQIFTKNQQQWRVTPLAEPAIAAWRKACSAAGFTRTAAHASYLINLASPHQELWLRSVELFIEEIRRCALLKIPYLVIHPGSHSGTGEDQGLKRAAAALNTALERAPKGVTVCLEVTAGQGSSLGYRLEHLAQIRKMAGWPRRIGYCLDTAHLFAAGYDFRGRKYTTLRRQIQRILGLGAVKVLHLNDSGRPCGSRVDRHAHIGHGHIGLEGFRPLIHDPAFAHVPKILETPKTLDARGRPWDQVNLATLHRLARGGKKA